MECRKLVRPGYQTKPPIYCHCGVTHAVFSLHEGKKLDQGHFCKKHAEELQKRFANGAAVVEALL